MAVQKTNTVLYEVQFAAKMLSLAPPLGVYDSLDEHAIVMGAAVNLAGIMVNDAHDWQHRRGLFTVTGDGTTLFFALPTDFARFVDNTGWSLTNQQPVLICNTQQWNALRASSIGVTVNPVCRLLGDSVYFVTAPSSGEVITFEYVLSPWVSDADVPATLKDVANKNGDIPLFDWLLMVLAIKAKWLELKAMDNANVMLDFNERLQQLTQNEVMAPVLSLNGGQLDGFRYLDGYYNVPVTGFGA